MKVRKRSRVWQVLVATAMLVLVTASACGNSATSAPTATKAPSTSSTAVPTKASTSSTTPAATAPAAATTAPTTAASGEPIKIGALFAVSGNNAPLGTPERDSALMYVDQINAKGGINGRKIQLVVYDTESDETKALTLAKKLIQEDKVIAIIGPSSTGESLALIDTIEKEKIPLISCAASIQIVQPIKPYVFKTPQSDKLAVSELFTYFKKKSYTKIAILTTSAGFGVTGKDAISAAAPDAGIQIVAAETFGDKDTDMTAQLTKIKGTDAQLVLTWGTNPGPAIIAKNMKQLGMTIPLFESHGVANKTFIDLAGDAANGVVFPAGKLLAFEGLPDSDPQKPVLSAFAKDFQAKYQKQADTFAGHAYDALLLIKTAFEKGATDRASLRDQLEKITNLPGTGGVFNMSATDHNGLGAGSFMMIKIINGQWTALKD